MHELAIFCLIRDGQTRLYINRWASVFLHREILFGPDDFETWATQLEEEEESDCWEGCCGGAVVDYDRRRLVWFGEANELEIPRVAAVHERMLRAAWPGFEVGFAPEGAKSLAQAAGADEPDETYDDERPETVLEAARIYDDDDDEEEEYDEDEEGFDDEEVRAWVTIIGADGAVRHRQLECLSEDLFNGDNEPLRELAELVPAEVPPEAVVLEGMWIDEPNKSIDIWGSLALQGRLPDIRQGWQGWNVEWAERGYEQQCAVAGPAGVPLEETEALAKILPLVLSTKRFDISAIWGVLSGSLKNTARKATGCLLVVICSPLVIFGLISGNWKPVGISVAITCAVVIAAFKVMTYRFKRAFASTLPDTGAADEEAPPAAGPQEESLRRERIEQLLVSAGLPGLAEVEPLFPEESELDLLD